MSSAAGTPSPTTRRRSRPGRTLAATPCANSLTASARSTATPSDDWGGPAFTRRSERGAGQGTAAHQGDQDAAGKDALAGQAPARQGTPPDDAALHRAARRLRLRADARPGDGVPELRPVSRV